MTIYIDLDLYGNENIDGTAIEHTEDDALSNALLSWLTSRKGEYIKNPERGGILVGLDFKNLSNENLEEFHFKIQNEFYKEFGNILTLQNLDIIPHYEDRYTEIIIIYKNILTGNLNSVTANIETSNSNKDIFEFQSIDLVGENLYKFVLMKLSQMTEQKLIFNSIENSFVWKYYKFINFNASDPYFENILEIINT